MPGSEPTQLDDLEQWERLPGDEAPPLEPLRPLVKEASWVTAPYASHLIAHSHAFYAEWTALQGQAPYAIYHYTGARGVKGIVESGGIWASDLLYLSDLHELDYVRDLIRAAIDARWSATDSLLSKFCAHANDALDPRAWKHSIFAACCCENGDALAQWRVHSRTGGGYSIGLRTASLDVEGGRYPPVHLRRVIYDPQRQRALIGSLLDRALMLLRSVEGDRQEAIAIVLEHVADHMAELVASFKPPAFREDQEWRLLLVSDTAYPDEVQSHMQFRAVAAHIVPYVPVDVSHAEGPESSPIAEVICGPLERAELSTRSIQLLLKQRSIAGARVRPSGLGI